MSDGHVFQFFAFFHFLLPAMTRSRLLAIM